MDRFQNVSFTSESMEEILPLYLHRIRNGYEELIKNIDV